MKFTEDSCHDPTKQVLQPNLRPKVDFNSKCGDNFKRTVFVDNMVHFVHRKNVVKSLYFDFFLNFSNQKFPQKLQ